MNVLFEVYEAFKLAGVPDGQAKKASEALSNRDNERLTNIEGRLTNMEKDMSSLKQDMSSLKQDMSSLKQDMSSLKQDMSSLKQDHYLLKWMLGFVLALLVTIITKLFL